MTTYKMIKNDVEGGSRGGAREAREEVREEGGQVMFGVTGKSDKELFPSFYPDADEGRVSSTFWDDFTIADAFGESAVRDTFRRAFGEWKCDYRYATELAVVTNKKCWSWHGRNEALCVLYRDLYFKVRDWCLRRFKGKEAEHYFKVTDQN